MSYHDEGYKEGYEDGLAGNPSRRQWPMGMLDFINDKDTTEWEEGYEEGYEDGEQERNAH